MYRKLFAICTGIAVVVFPSSVYIMLCTYWNWPYGAWGESIAAFVGFVWSVAATSMLIEVDKPDDNKTNTDDKD